MLSLYCAISVYEHVCGFPQYCNLLSNNKFTRCRSFNCSNVSNHHTCHGSLRLRQILLSQPQLLILTLTSCTVLHTLTVSVYLFIYYIIYHLYTQRYRMTPCIHIVHLRNSFASCSRGFNMHLCTSYGHTGMQAVTHTHSNKNKLLNNIF